MSSPSHKLLRLLVRLGLAGLFLYAASLKLLDPAGFAQDLIHYRLLPERLAAPLALGLPVLELVSALSLLTFTYMRGGALLSALMLLSFAAAMAQAKLRGINLDCGCFGAASNVQVSWTKVAINLGLAMLALWLARPAVTRVAFQTPPEPNPPAASPGGSPSA